MLWWPRLEASTYKTMGNFVISENGFVRKLADVEFAEDIITTKNTKDQWAVIDKLVKAWAKRAPDDVEAITINLDQYRETTDDKKFGQTTGGKDQERRFKLAFPSALQAIIRTVYKSNELQFDSKFYDEFAKRYSFFRVAEKD